MSDQLSHRLRRRLASDRLIAVLRDPACLTAIAAAEWPDFLGRARRTGLWAAISAAAGTDRLQTRLPDPVRRHMADTRQTARRNRTNLLFEIDRLQRALAGLNVDLVLLKGAAYLAKGFAFAETRLAGDVDVLVPKDALPKVEQRLLDLGWTGAPISPYDDRYYREWMHELPPLSHPKRLIPVDLHHAITPLTSRYRPPSDALFEARESCEIANLSVLGAADMVLHSGTHLFTEEFSNPLRQLSDLRHLLTHHGRTPAFWTQLADRAQVLGLERVLFYVTRYVGAVFDLPIPVQALPANGRPGTLVLALMDAMVVRACCRDGRHPPRFDFAGWGLYVRSHWLKMPPAMLARHLTVKAWKNATGGKAEAATVAEQPGAGGLLPTDGARRNFPE